VLSQLVSSEPEAGKRPEFDSDSSLLVCKKFDMCSNRSISIFKNDQSRGAAIRILLAGLKGVENSESSNGSHSWPVGGT